MSYKLERGNRCAVIGYGSWATAIVKILTEKEQCVGWHITNPEVREGLASDGHNCKSISDVEADTCGLAMSEDLNIVVAGAERMILATP